jgi:multicomponent Na+:H+ antiporter subunit B
MIIPLDIILFVVLIIAAILAINVRDLLAAVSLLAAFSLFASLIFAGVNAVDVSLVEAALGAGLTGVLFIGAILATTRHSTAKRNRRRRLAVLPLLVAFIGLMLYASSGLPDRGDPDAPAHTGVSAAYLENSLEETQTPNVVTALLADYRSQDTLGETLVIVTAALAATLVLIRRREDEPGEPSPLDPKDTSPPKQGPPQDEPPGEPGGEREAGPDRTDATGGPTSAPRGRGRIPIDPYEREARRRDQP